MSKSTTCPSVTAPLEERTGVEAVGTVLAGLVLKVRPVSVQVHSGMAWMRPPEGLASLSVRRSLALVTCPAPTPETRTRKKVCLSVLESAMSVVLVPPLVAGELALAVTSASTTAVALAGAGTHAQLAVQPLGHAALAAPSNSSLGWLTTPSPHR